MEQTKPKTGLYWILFLLSVVLFFVMLKNDTAAAYVSMVLPLNCTFFAKALDLM